LNILPEEGLEVVCTGKVTTYAGQSKYQIIIENIEPYGVGALMALLEKRKEKLLKENLFDDNFKKQIPFLPKRIGVITSPTGAVIRDILHRIEDRFPVNITVWPVKVQGDSSPEEIIDAIEGFHLLDQSNLEKPDVIIIARGGGSVEDLWGFNDEALVRKVFDSKIPIISAIGHETDTTLIDLVADLRAPTPTAAAEMAVPVRKILITSVEDSYERIKNYINNKIEFEERSLLLLDKAIPKIEVMLKNYNLRYKKASSILNISLVSMIKHYQDIFLRKTVSFKANMLTKNFNFTKDDFLEVSKSLINSTVNIFDKKTNSLQLQSGLLDVLSHNSVLKRGFAIVKDKKSKIITSSKKIKEDEELMINFYKNDKIKVSLKRDK
jgi:exodeoxyribonuclease VII large subunit